MRVWTCVKWTMRRIIPDYSESISPYFSASLPFVASSVALRTNNQKQLEKITSEIDSIN